ncbi:MAG: XdhC family protein [Planctomycetota bacterium]
MSGQISKVIERGVGQLRPTSENVLPFYLEKSLAGQRVCLVTQYHVDDAAPRPEGSQIAVSEDGESFGFITGGCAEAAIRHEALMALTENRSRCIRIGSDSPWFDIKLPCGAGINLHFSVTDSTDCLLQACEKIAGREPVALAFDVHRDEVKLCSPQEEFPFFDGRTFRRNYLPVTRLAVFGAGPYVGALRSIAREAELEVMVWSPEIENDDNQQQTLSLSRRTEISPALLDSWTAAVLLFHEHDWEPGLLKSILATECFYVGALGSRKTHRARLAHLRNAGVSEEACNRIHGPVGLQISAGTPAEIAISILSEIISDKRKTRSVGEVSSGIAPS